MDSAAVVLGKSVTFSSSSYYASSAKELLASRKSVKVGGRRRPAIGILSAGFCDQGHWQYYNSQDYGSSSSSVAAAAAAMMTVMNGKEEKAAKDRAPKKMKMKKKQSKLLKELSRDLSTFSQMGFGLDSDGALVDQVKHGMMTEAADLLLERLQKMKAEEKELKRKKKEEKARLKASQMQTRYMDCEMSSGSSSSSSESSDSECGEVVDMKNLKQAQVKQNGLPQVITPTIDSIVPPVPAPPSPSSPKKSSLQAQNGCCSGTNIGCTKPGNAGQVNGCCSEPNIAFTKPSNVREANAITLVDPCQNKIEVCMGGKCKKSGGAALLEEFQKAVGNEGAVSGCKCMGKCKDGPNVKVLNGTAADNTVNTQPSNSLCIGVGLEDVETIVANFLGQSHNQMGYAPAS